MRHATPLQEMPALAVRWCALLGLTVRADLEGSGDERLFPNRLALTGPDAAHLLSGKPQPLDALQYLLHEAQGERDDDRLVYLDVQGSRLFRMRELVAMAGLAAQRARDTGGYIFVSLTPKERRWVHLALEGEPGVESRSEGMGAAKNLRVVRKP